MRRAAVTAVLVPLAVLAAGCGGATTHPPVPGASPSNGLRLIDYYGCGACHMISGVNPQGHAGPSLVDYASRRMVAGTLPNTTANLVHWIEQPQKILPQSAMPDLGIGPNGARDIASYLYQH